MIVFRRSSAPSAGPRAALLATIRGTVVRSRSNNGPPRHSARPPRQSRRPSAVAAGVALALSLAGCVWVGIQLGTAGAAPAGSCQGAGSGNLVLTETPCSGQVGSTIELTTEPGCPGGSTYTWGQYVPLDPKPKADSSSVTVTVPTDAEPDQYTITVTCGTSANDNGGGDTSTPGPTDAGATASVSFTVTDPTVALSPASGPPGTAFTVTTGGWPVYCRVQLEFPYDIDTDGESETTLDNPVKNGTVVPFTVYPDSDPGPETFGASCLGDGDDVVFTTTATFTVTEAGASTPASTSPITVPVSSSAPPVTLPPPPPSRASTTPTRSTTPPSRSRSVPPPLPPHSSPPTAPAPSSSVPASPVEPSLLGLSASAPRSPVAPVPSSAEASAPAVAGGALIPAALTLSSLSITPGGSLEATGKGCVSGAPVELDVGHTRVGSSQADSAGHFRAPVNLASIPVGRYTVDARCGRLLTASLDVVLVSRVSANTSTLTIVVFVLLLGLLLYRRRLSRSLSRPKEH